MFGTSFFRSNLSFLGSLFLSFHVFIRTGLSERDPSEIADVAQRYIVRRGIQFTDVLIFDASSLLTNGSVRLWTSFLSLQETLPPAHLGAQRFTSPLMHEALASPSLIVLLFRAGEYDDFLDLVQNIQHKCLLQIIFIKKEPNPYVSSSPTYLWKDSSAPILRCSRTYDYLMTETLNAKQESCENLELKCRVSDVRLETVLAFVKSSYSLALSLTCNNTSARLRYQAQFNDVFSNRSVHDAHMRTWYSVCSETTECYSLILRASTDLTAFVQPFDWVVWIVTCLSMLLTATIFAWTQPEPIPVKLCQMTLNFIAACSIEANCKKYSVLILACTILLMTFLLSTIYSNTVMSYFLEVARDEKPDTSRSDTLDYCRFSSMCDTMFLTERFDLEGDYHRYCSLSERAKRACKGPLRKEVFHNDILRKTHSAWGERLSCHLQRTASVKSLVKITRRTVISQRLLVLTRTSKTLERLMQSGFISQRVFERGILLKGRTSDGFFNEFALKDQANSTGRNKTDWKKYVTFDEEGSLFDLMKFRELIPLVATCGFIVLCSAAFEQLLSNNLWSRASDTSHKLGDFISMSALRFRCRVFTVKNRFVDHFKRRRPKGTDVRGIVLTRRTRSSSEGASRTDAVGGPVSEGERKGSDEHREK